MSDELSLPLDAASLETLTTLDPSPGQPLSAFVQARYAELRSLAQRIGRGDVHANSLLNTAFRRLAQSDLRIEGESQGFALFSRVMRHAIVDRIRARKAEKRGGDRVMVPYDPGRDGSRERPAFDLLALNDALERLRELDPRKWEVVEHKWFAGLTDEETAHAIGVSLATVERDWKFAKAWLRQQLGADPS